MASSHNSNIISVGIKNNRSDFGPNFVYRNYDLDIFNIRPEFDFNDDVNFIETGMLDSFDIVTLVTSLDEEFGISIDAIGYVLAAEVALALFPKTVKTPRRAVQILPSDAYPKSPALDLLKLSVKTLRTADAIVERFLNKNIVYAVKSPIKAQVLVALFTKLAADHCALSLAPGVAFTVTPTAPETVVCPKPV